MHLDDNPILEFDRDEASLSEPRWSTVVRRCGLITAVALALYLGAYGSLRLGGVPEVQSETARSNNGALHRGV